MSRPSTERRGRRACTLLLVAVVALGTSAIATGAHAITGHTPFGRLDTVVQSGPGVVVTGWAIDPDTHASIQVEILLDGHATWFSAATARLDVARTYPAYGSLHGFRARVPAAAGRHTVCAYAIDYGPGTTNGFLGCRTIITLDYNPFGEITTVRQFPGGFTATGWVIDHDLPRPALAVKLNVDGNLTAATANLPRADVAMRFPSAGPAHGFSISAHAAEGLHRVCLFATNIGLGTDATVVCRAVGLNFSPVGAITALTQAPNGFRIQGWALDPDTSAPVTVTVLADGRTLGSATANLASSTHNGHGFAASFLLGIAGVPPGTHTICVHGVNLGTYGRIRQIGCRAVALNFNPTVAITALRQSSPGYQVSGWGQDPDTSAPIHVIVTTDGKAAANVVANRAGGPHAGHNYLITLPAINGRHTVCVVSVNAGYGSGDSAPACAAITLNFNPFGALEKLGRRAGSTAVLVTGWAIDPDSTNPVSVRISIDGRVMGTPSARYPRPDIAMTHPGYGPYHGMVAYFAATDGEHRVCATAVNVLGGTGDTAVGCRIINAVHPVVPSAPTTVVAIAGYGRATVTWSAPRSDGGAPWTSYTVTSSGHWVTVGANTRAATVTGLTSNTHYAFSVMATNVAGRSVPGRSAIVLTATNPPPQTTPAPISTSRYIRNIVAASATELTMMRREGAADATANPSGHGYLILLDIGGQDQVDGGVMLSATTRFVSYPHLVNDLNAYVDGYHSKQRASAPVTIALGTNNDMDVSAASGVGWARSVVNPVRAHALRYIGMTVAGANDIEPGFRGSYAQTVAWLGGYLAGTLAPFVFNGSADGCAWTVTNRGCNNGWTMARLYQLSAGAGPRRIVNLPQIYNNTMAAQWKYISLTGVGQNRPRINFGGALTEWTACAQAGGCGSLTGNNAWRQMWSQLQSHPALRTRSLPYSTDLRIDR